MKKIWRKYRELITYFCAGLSTTLLNWVVFGIYRSIFGSDGFHVIINTGIAWLISTAYAFFVYKLIVFCSKDMHPRTVFKEAAEFVSARILTLLIEAAGMWFFCELLGFNDLIFAFDVTSAGQSVFCIPVAGDFFSKLLMLVVTTVLNYLVSKFFIFKKENKENDKNEE